MTLLFRLFLSAALFAGALAQANIVKPSRPGDHYGPIRPLPDNGRHDDYGPIRPDPDYGYDRRGSRISEEIYIGRYVRNEYIDILRQIDHLQGYRVESVRVLVQRSREVNASVELLVNGRSEDSSRVDVGREMTLNPRSLLEIGRHLRDLEIYARGEMLIDRIVVDLVSERNPPPYDDGRDEFSVRLNLPSYLPPQPRLDLTRYIDVRSYQGYRVKGVEITADSRSIASSVEVQINSFSEGSIRVSPYQNTQQVRSRQNLVLGSSFGSLILVPRGDVNIIEVRLILSRY